MAAPETAAAAPGRGPAPRALSLERGPGRTAAPFATLLTFMWVLLLFEPEWLLSSFGGGGILKRIPTLMLPFVIYAIARTWRSEALYWPFIGLLLLHLVHMPMVSNRGYLMIGFKLLYHYYFLFAVTACVVRDARTACRLLDLYAFSFLWFGLHGSLRGTVPWHSIYSNPDSFGPLMGMAVGYAFYYGSAAETRWKRMAGYLAALLGLLGVITSLARGAVLAVAIVAVIVWWRSPRKFVALAAAIAVGIVGLVSVNIIYPDGKFWKEMSTVSEGTQGGTGQERWVMWGIGLEVFQTAPIIGVGPNNLGPTASEIIQYDAERARYHDPANLYAKKLHNIYIQILSETGVVGAILWLWMILDFFRRVWAMRRPAAIRRWRAMPGSRLDVGQISRGLECAMVGYLANGMVYNQIYTSWFWTLIAFTYMLSNVVERAPVMPPPPPPGPGPRPDPSPDQPGAPAEGDPRPASLSGLLGAS